MPLLQIYNMVFFIDYYAKWESEAGNRSTDNTMAERQRTKRPT